MREITNEREKTNNNKIRNIHTQGKYWSNSSPYLTHIITPVAHMMSILSISYNTSHLSDILAVTCTYIEIIQSSLPG